MSPKASIWERIGLEPAERALFGWAGLCLVLMGASAFALLNTAETLFLKRVGVEALPLALLASSGLLVLTTSLASRIASQEPARALPRVLACLAAAPLPFLFLVDGQSPGIFAALLLVSRQVLALGMFSFWLAMGSLVPARRAKQLFAPLASSVTVGGIAGSFGSGPLARWIGVEGLIALCAISIACAAFMGSRLRRHTTRPFEQRPGGSVAGSTTAGVSFGELLRSNRLFRLLGIALFCGGALSPILYFEFTSALDAATQGPDGEEQLLSLYSQFRGWLNVAMLLSQLWLSSQLYRRFGLPLSITLWPAAYVIGFAWLGIDFALLVAFATFGAAKISEDGIADSAVRVLYSLFPDDIRARASGLLSGPINRLGGVSGNAFVMGALAVGQVEWVGWLSLPIAGSWLVSALVLWRAYPGLLLKASAEHGLARADLDRSILLDPATLRSLATNLADPDPKMCRAALDLLVDGDVELVVPLLAGAVEAAPESTRFLLVEALHHLVEHMTPGSGRSREAVDALARCLAAKPPFSAAERADLLQVYARLTAGDDAPQAMASESKKQLERSLGDRAAPVRLAAIAELHRRSAPPPGVPDLDRALADALTASDALIRRTARKELRAMLLEPSPDESWLPRLHVLAEHLQQRADRAETAEALLEIARKHDGLTQPIAQQVLPFTTDRDPRVRGALLSTIGHAGLAEQGPRLVSALGARSKEESDGAHEGLVALGSAAALPLLVGMELGGRARREAVVDVLRELEVGPETLDTLRSRQLVTIRTSILLRSALEDLPGSAVSLLCRCLDERIAEGFGALLDLLSALYDDPRLTELERQLRRSNGGPEHDILIEAIEALLGRADRAAIVPLLETRDAAKRRNAAAAALGRDLPGSGEALSELAESADATIAKLAQVITLEGLDAIGDAHAMPSSMSIAVRLQDVPAFNRLGTQQLMSLAEHLQEQKVAPGESIYSTGDEGLGLYFVLEGEIELRRGSVLVERLGEGSFFGELSVLDGIPRGSDAIATSPAQLLRLERDDLLPLLDEAPELAIGLAQFLSGRVRRLVDRLEEASSTSGDAE